MRGEVHDGAGLREPPEGDNTRRARFLITVVNGLGLERALPAEDSVLQSETETLYTAVDSVLGSRTS